MEYRSTFVVPSSLVQSIPFTHPYVAGAHSLADQTLVEISMFEVSGLGKLAGVEPLCALQVGVIEICAKQGAAREIRAAEIGRCEADV